MSDDEAQIRRRRYFLALESAGFSVTEGAVQMPIGEANRLADTIESLKDCYSVLTLDQFAEIDEQLSGVTEALDKIEYLLSRARRDAEESGKEKVLDSAWGGVETIRSLVLSLARDAARL